MFNIKTEAASSGLFRSGTMTPRSNEPKEDFGSSLRHVHEDLISRLCVLQDQISIFMDAQAALTLEQGKLSQVVQSMKGELGTCLYNPFNSAGTGRASIRVRRHAPEDDEAHADAGVSIDRTPDASQTLEDLSNRGMASASADKFANYRRRSRSTGSLKYEKFEEHIPEAAFEIRLPERRPSVYRPPHLETKNSISNNSTSVTFNELADVSTLGEIELEEVEEEDGYKTPSSWFKRNASCLDLEGLAKARTSTISRVTKRAGYEQKKLKISHSRRFDLQRLDVTEVIERPRFFKALHPDRPFRSSLDMLALMLLLHDAITVPYLMCWDVGDEDYTWGLWATRIFWTLDLPLSLVTGFRTQDQMLEIRLMPAMKHYLKTWFIPDLLLVILDWFGFLMKDLRILRAARVRSSFRAFRLVRAFSKMPRAADIWARLVLASDKKEIHVVLAISRVIFVILWINHLVACGWYAMGMWVSPDTGMTWLQNDNENQYRHSALYEYSTSLHWAITQMTPGSMEVVPMCTPERIYTVITLFIGLVVGSTLIAILSSILTQYRLQLEDKSKKFMQLQVFLSQQKIDPLLSMAIKRNVTMRVSQKSMLKKREIDYLKEIPLEMQKELNHGVYMNVIGEHKFMNSVSDLDRGDAMRGLCNSAFQVWSVAAGSYLFEEGGEGDMMFFVMEGTFQYLPGPCSAEGAFPRASDQLSLHRGDWCCEPALWTEWEYLGSLYVSSDSEVLWIRALETQKELAAFPFTMEVVNSYCTAFTRHLNERGIIHSDLPFRFDYTDVMLSMDDRQRLSLAAPALEKLKHQPGLRMRKLFHKRMHDRLKREVELGKCLLGTIHGEVERTVYVVALRLSHAEDSRCLVKLGETLPESTEFKSLCVLPGTKKTQGDSLVESLHKLLVTDLKSCGNDIKIYLDSGCEITSIVRESPTYGIRTRYMRSTAHGSLKSDHKLNRMPVPGKARKAAEGARSLLDLTLSHDNYERREKAIHAITSVNEVFFMHAQGAERQSARVSYNSTSDLAELMESVEARDTISMYAWLTTSQLEELSHEAADIVLRRWITEMNRAMDPSWLRSTKLEKRPTKEAQLKEVQLEAFGVRTVSFKDESPSESPRWDSEFEPGNSGNSEKTAASPKASDTNHTFDKIMVRL